MNLAIVENQIAACLGDNYIEYRNEINKYSSNPSKITILYCCIMIESKCPNILEFIEEFIKTISQIELMEPIDNRILQVDNRTLNVNGNYILTDITLLEYLVSMYNENINCKIIKLIIDAGANVNAVCNDGNSVLADIILTYLYYVKKYNYDDRINRNTCDIIKLLISSGADVNFKVNCSGDYTIFEYFINIHIIKNGVYFDNFNAEIFELFLKHGAEFNIKKFSTTKFFENIIRMHNFYNMLGLKQSETKLAFK